RTWAAVEIDAGDALHVGAIVRGARAYLSVSGGWNGEPVFKSVSTHFSAGFGGHEGRALRAGDRLEFTSGTPAPREAKALRELPESARAFLRGEIERKALRAIEGTPAHVGQFDEAALSKFWKGAFAVSSKSDRSGVRLEGEPIRAGGKATGNGGAMISEGMVRGAVQVPPNGLPIVLGADYPTTGGYPVIACVASVDFPALGQARPGDVLRFERVTLGRALELLRERERRFEEEVPRT
ncbi:MAG TPA: hypothetical protein VG797_08910, partial [Phycisphaerales bacterium]|nr:hypothetical protein [Phycisphaerales bacterium]